MLQVNKLALAALLPLAIGSGAANALEAKCEYIDKTVVKTTGIIEATRNYERATTDYAEEKRVCAVKIDVKIDKNWQETKGFYIFGPDMSENEACEKAEDRAKISALEQHAPQEVQSEVEHVCEETIEVKKESPPEVVPPEVVVKKQPEPAVDHNNSNYNNNGRVFWRNGVCYVRERDISFHPDCHSYSARHPIPKIYEKHPKQRVNIIGNLVVGGLLLYEITR